MSTASPGIPALERFAQRTTELMSLPAVALRVLGLTREENVDVRELKSCVEQDPALTCKILRVVNSSLFGLARPVSDLSQAIALLGNQPLKMLVLGFSLPTPGNSTLAPAVLERYWRHVVLKSVAARELAESCWKRSGDEAFTAGLLQDIGLLVLVQDLGETFIQFLNGAWDNGHPLRPLEENVLGFDHALLSAQLLKQWGLPESLTRAIAVPHDPLCIAALPADEQRLPQILDLAELLARAIIERHVTSFEDVLEAGQAYCGLRREQLQELLKRVEPKAAFLADAFSLAWGEQEYALAMTDAHQQLARMAEAATTDQLAPPRRPAEFLAELQGAVASRSDSTSLTIEKRRPLGQQSLPGIRLNQSCPPELAQYVGTVVSHCRQIRCPVSLVLIEPDKKSLPDNADAMRFVQRLADLIQGEVEGEGHLLTIVDRRVAVILLNHDRHRALAFSRQILDGARAGLASLTPIESPLALSIGVASLGVPPRNFPAQEMIQAAERCLNAAHLSGGDTVKSIEIF